MPLFTKVTPLGSAPVSESEAAGLPVVVTEKVPAVPAVKVVLLALVIVGAWEAFNFSARNPRITLSVVPVPNVAVCAPAGTPALSSISCPVRFKKFGPEMLLPASSVFVSLRPVKPVRCGRVHSRRYIEHLTAVRSEAPRSCFWRPNSRPCAIIRIAHRSRCS